METYTSSTDIRLLQSYSSSAFKWLSCALYCLEKSKCHYRILNQNSQNRFFREPHLSSFWYPTLLFTLFTIKNHHVRRIRPFRMPSSISSIAKESECFTTIYTQGCNLCHATQKSMWGSLQLSYWTTWTGKIYFPFFYRLVRSSTFAFTCIAGWEDEGEARHGKNAEICEQGYMNCIMAAALLWRERWRVGTINSFKSCQPYTLLCLVSWLSCIGFGCLDLPIELDNAKEIHKHTQIIKSSLFVCICFSLIFLNDE